MKKPKAERRENDHYVTPAWSIQRFLEQYRPKDAVRILDPCAARGELIATARKFLPLSQWAACEINPEFETDLKVITPAVVIEDFLTQIPLFKACGFDLVLTNPPYALARDFIEAGLEVAPVVAMLLRINFLASRSRRHWLTTKKPGIFVLPNRPSFTGEGGDQTEYAWFVFGDQEVASYIFYCDLTPAEEIRAANKRAREIHNTEPSRLALVSA